MELGLVLNILPEGNVDNDQSTYYSILPKPFYSFAVFIRATFCLDSGSDIVLSFSVVLSDTVVLG